RQTLALADMLGARAAELPQEPTNPDMLLQVRRSRVLAGRLKYFVARRLSTDPDLLKQLQGGVGQSPSVTPRNRSIVIEELFDATAKLCALVEPRQKSGLGEVALVTWVLARVRLDKSDTTLFACEAKLAEALRPENQRWPSLLQAARGFIFATRAQLVFESAA